MAKFPVMKGIVFFDVLLVEMLLLSELAVDISLTSSSHLITKQTVIFQSICLQ